MVVQVFFNVRVLFGDAAKFISRFMLKPPREKCIVIYGSFSPQSPLCLIFIGLYAGWTTKKEAKWELERKAFDLIWGR